MDVSYMGRAYFSPFTPIKTGIFGTFFDVRGDMGVDGTKAKRKRFDRTHVSNLNQTLPATACHCKPLRNKYEVKNPANVMIFSKWQ